jgi:hypothetical protein
VDQFSFRLNISLAVLRIIKKSKQVIMIDRDFDSIPPFIS